MTPFKPKTCKNIKLNVNAYINDYKIHNKKIIWIIDGNNKSIIITEKNTDKCTLTF